MFEEVFDYYRKNLTFYRLVTVKYGFFRIVGLALFLVAPLVFAVLFIIKNNDLFLGLTFFSGIAAGLLRSFFDRQIIKRNYGNYNGVITEYGYSKVHFDRMVAERMKNFLNEKYNYDEELLEKIIFMAHEKLKNERLPSIVFTTFFSALFIPLWNSYVSNVFNRISCIENLTLYFVIFLVLLYPVFLIILIIRDMYSTIITRQLMLSNFITLLQNVILDIKTEGNNKKNKML